MAEAAAKEAKAATIRKFLAQKHPAETAAQAETAATDISMLAEVRVAADMVA